MTEFKTFARKALRAARLSTRLETLGVTCKFNRHLDRMTNVETCWGGHLKNATCHYTNRYEYGGNTYNYRHVLKAHGFRWDNSTKVWWKAAPVDTIAVSSEICRAAAERN